mmetsp:Transcript_13834/g.37651  ORF Transcript_13834/g.37651 Transcript_13834/m.37651 type:complete len:267 (-) Transcript_13834:274-1074(-)
MAVRMNRILQLLAEVSQASGCIVRLASASRRHCGENKGEHAIADPAIWLWVATRHEALGMALWATSEITFKTGIVEAAHARVLCPLPLPFQAKLHLLQSCFFSLRTLFVKPLRVIEDLFRVRRPIFWFLGWVFCKARGAAPFAKRLSTRAPGFDFLFLSSLQALELILSLDLPLGMVAMQLLCHLRQIRTPAPLRCLQRLCSAIHAAGILIIPDEIAARTSPGDIQQHLLFPPPGKGTPSRLALGTFVVEFDPTMRRRNSGRRSGS